MVLCEREDEAKKGGSVEANVLCSRGMVMEGGGEGESGTIERLSFSFHFSLSGISDETRSRGGRRRLRRTVVLSKLSRLAELDRSTRDAVDLPGVRIL